MSNGKPKRPHLFPSSKETVPASRRTSDSAQTRSPTYRLAFADEDFLLADETRAVRLQLEWLKFDGLLDNANIDHTIVVFGSARIDEAAQAKEKVALLKQQSKLDPDNATLKQLLKSAHNLEKLAVYYNEARRFANRVVKDGEKAFGFASTIITGGGPGIMEAANRGAFDAGAPNIGLNIVLPTEQHPNPYVSPHLSFQFHYFAIRKMHFLMRARAIVAFPGGFGTLDEIFETLTLRQTGRVSCLPILLCGKEYWRKIVNIDALVDAGVISPDDTQLFHYIETADEAFQAIADFYKKRPLQC